MTSVSGDRMFFTGNLDALHPSTRSVILDSLGTIPIRGGIHILENLCYEAFKRVIACEKGAPRGQVTFSFSPLLPDYLKSLEPALKILLAEHGLRFSVKEHAQCCCELDESKRDNFDRAMTAVDQAEQQKQQQRIAEQQNIASLRYEPDSDESDGDIW